MFSEVVINKVSSGFERRFLEAEINDVLEVQMTAVLGGRDERNV